MFQQLLTDTGKEISTGIVYLKIYKNFNQTCDNTQKCDPLVPFQLEAPRSLQSLTWFSI
jgi:hypothetical protein